MPKLTHHTTARTTALTTWPKPTIVLVHGAFADGSGWTSVIERLHRRGLTTVAVANPLRGVRSDADADALDTHHVLGFRRRVAHLRDAAAGPRARCALVRLQHGDARHRHRRDQRLIRNCFEMGVRPDMPGLGAFAGETALNEAVNWRPGLGWGIGSGRPGCRA